MLQSHFIREQKSKKEDSRAVNVRRSIMLVSLVVFVLFTRIFSVVSGGEILIKVRLVDEISTSTGKPSSV